MHIQYFAEAWLAMQELVEILESMTEDNDGGVFRPGGRVCGEWVCYKIYKERQTSGW